MKLLKFPNNKLKINQVMPLMFICHGLWKKVIIKKNIYIKKYMIDIMKKII